MKRKFSKFELECIKTAKDKGAIPLFALSDKEFRRLANSNHIWINSFVYAINPSNKAKIKLAEDILEKLKYSKHKETLGISNATALTINWS